MKVTYRKNGYSKETAKPLFIITEIAIWFILMK